MFVIQLLVLIGSNGGGLLSTVHLPASPRGTGTWGHVPALYFHMNRTHHPLDKQKSPVLSQARGEHRSAQTSATDAAKITPSPVRALCWEETFIGPDSPAWQHKERQGDGYSLFSLSGSKERFALHLALGQPDHICCSAQTPLGQPALIPSGGAREVLPDAVSGSWGAITTLGPALAGGVSTAFSQDIDARS